MFELMMPAAAMERFFYPFGIVPVRYTHPDWAFWVGFPLAHTRNRKPNLHR
jgi:hypothetical protein